jgi:hypothetical protein
VLLSIEDVHTDVHTAGSRLPEDLEVTEGYRVERFAAKRRLNKALQTLGIVWLFVETLASDSLGAGGRRFKSYRPDQITLGH